MGPQSVAVTGSVTHKWDYEFRQNRLRAKSRMGNHRIRQKSVLPVNHDPTQYSLNPLLSVEPLWINQNPNTSKTAVGQFLYKLIRRPPNNTNKTLQVVTRRKKNLIKHDVIHEIDNVKSRQPPIHKHSSPRHSKINNLLYLARNYPIRQIKYNTVHTWKIKKRLIKTWFF